ncbi:Uncharacterised protein [Rothia dentocariosa]|uniref:Uncharacterized protein n=1 Tax=Rothia dentocariosa TaxID=2047 RepID=A0A3S4Z1E1_9MICC|nr:Uncharacterised protein [Rothia dentocariosa]
MQGAGCIRLSHAGGKQVARVKGKPDSLGHQDARRHLHRLIAQVLTAVHRKPLKAHNLIGHLNSPAMQRQTSSTGLGAVELVPHTCLFLQNLHLGRLNRPRVIVGVHSREQNNARRFIQGLH